MIDDAPQHYPVTGNLMPANASAVILTDERGWYFVQARDDMPGIFYPGHMGLFGGAREGVETYEECAVRELREEIGLDFEGRLTEFMALSLNFEPFGHGHVARVMFTASITTEEIGRVRLGEGRRATCIDGVTLLRDHRVVPYDAFALWQHFNL